MLGKLNLGSLMKGAKKIQDMIEKNQEELAKTEVTGESGAGLVKVTMNCLNVTKNLQLADELLSQPKEIIQDLIIAAFNLASQKARNTASKMADLTHFLGGLNDEEKQL